MASGKQAGSGPARPHLLVNAIPGTQRKSPGTGNRASHHPVPAAAPAPRSPSPVQPARHTRSPGPSAAGVLPSRFLVTCQVPRRARLPPPRPRCARLPAPAGLSPRCAGRHLRPSRSGRRRAPSRPRTRPQPRQSVLHIRIRAPAAAPASRPMAPAAPSDPPRPASAATSQPPSRPCGSRSGSTPDRTSACHPLCVRHGCHLRGIGDQVTRAAERLTRSVTTLRPAAATRVAGLLHFAAGWRLPGTHSLGRAAAARAASDGGLRLAVAVLCH